MAWFYYSLISALFTTFYILISRCRLKNQGDPRAFAFWSDFFGAVCLILIALFEKKYFQLNFFSLFIVIMVALIYGMVDSLLMKGRQLEEVSKTSIISQTGSIWALLGGVLLFKEALSIYKVIGILLIILGNLITLWKKQKFSFSKGIQYFFIGTFLGTIGYLIDKYMVGNIFSPGLYKAILFSLATGWIFISIPNRVARVKKELSLQKTWATVVGTCLALSIYFLMRALQIGEASKVLPICSLSLVFSVLAGIVVLGEKERIMQKIIGVIITFIGVFVLKT